MISHNAEFFGDIAPEILEVPGDGSVKISGAEWMEAVKAKELAEAKAKKNSAPTQEEEKFDALGKILEISRTISTASSCESQKLIISRLSLFGTLEKARMLLFEKFTRSP